MALALLAVDITSSDVMTLLGVVLGGGAVAALVNQGFTWVRTRGEARKLEAEADKVDADATIGLLTGPTKILFDEYRAALDRYAARIAQLEAAQVARDKRDEETALELGRLRAELGTAQAELRQLRDELTVANLRENADQEELARLKRENDDLRAEVGRLQARVAELEARR